MLQYIKKKLLIAKFKIILESVYESIGDRFVYCFTKT